MDMSQSSARSMCPVGNARYIVAKNLDEKTVCERGMETVSDELFERPFKPHNMNMVRSGWGIRD
jgi:hypothetical protein